MPNILDTFIEVGNVAALPIIGDTFTWGSSDYVGTVSDIAQDEFFTDEATGTRKNTERFLEVALSQFPGSTRPAIRDTITYQADNYTVVEITSLDTTNVVYKIRKPLQTA